MMLSKKYEANDRVQDSETICLEPEQQICPCNRPSMEFSLACKGISLVILSFVLFTSLSYVLVVAGFMPRTGHAVLGWLRDARYYGVLCVQTLVATTVAVYLNWLGLKFFRHN